MADPHPPRSGRLSEWLDHLSNLHPQTIALGLERVQAVLRHLATPLEAVVLTVGGTNGKGSTCAMLESTLRAAGLRVGLYTSPHLLTYNERVRVDAQPASDAELCEAFVAVEAARRGIALTYFEFGTLAAVWHFARHRVDVAILEVGLGGRLDAVNAFDADCAIVTSVDLDHTDYLGSTREAIAREKAGIFRAGKPAICGERDLPEIARDYARSLGTPLHQLGRDFDVAATATSWSYWSPWGHRSDLPLPALPGACQLGNAACCLAALDSLRSRLPVTEEAIRTGLARASLPGRFQVLGGRPQTILDVAHNPHAARALAANLAARPFAGRTIAVFAMLADKDIEEVAGTLSPLVDRWMAAGLGEPRGASAEELRRRLSGLPADAVSVYPGVELAYRRALALAGENDRILVFGSFHTVAAVLRLWVDERSE
ncbi:MAG: bifunctional tetrahydrofolate synthase/dihydrofolate synthase [Betaproteobacteria bacterium]|nr:bifunctional tetrahydrofolate synthase/dihydrofolate synthase [Betaproteobacteria bacterium]